MKQLLLSFALVFCALTSFAQQDPKVKDPCGNPVVELYDANRKKLSEGTLPTGKVTILVRNNPKCEKHFTFKVEKAILYLVGGVRPLAQAEIKGNTFDFSDWQNHFNAADRILFEITEITYNHNKGEKTGDFPGSVFKTWTFKKQ